VPEAGGAGDGRPLCLIYFALARSQHDTQFTGIATLGPLAHLNISADAARRALPDVIERLRARLGDDAFDSAVAKGAEMNADQIVAFALASIDDELLALDDA